MGYARGDSAAALTVYEFSDFGCRYCAEFASRTMPRLEREFISSGSVRWVFVPVASGAFPNGEEAALAAICADAQDRFWPMHHLLFERQAAWTVPRDPAPHFLAYAAELGLDATRFDSCYEGEEARSALRGANRAALLFGVRAYPSFFVGGRLVEGALAADVFGRLLRDLLPSPDEPRRAP